MARERRGEEGLGSIEVLLARRGEEGFMYVEVLLARRGEEGFMYVEVLLALVLLAFALLATAPMFILASSENAAAGDQTFATTLANDQAERMKRLPFAALAPGTDVVSNRQMSYDRSWVVAGDTPHPGMSTVTVTVTPRRRSGHGGPRVATVDFYRVP